MTQAEHYDAIVIGSGEGGKYLAWHLAQAGQYGVATGPVSVDMKAVVARKRAMVEGLVAFHLERYEATGAELIMGNTPLIGPTPIEVALNDGGGAERAVWQGRGKMSFEISKGAAG